MREVSEEDEEKLSELKSSFPCWVEQKEEVDNHLLELTSKLMKNFLVLIFLYLVTIAVGYVVGEANNIQKLLLKTTSYSSYILYKIL